MQVETTGKSNPPKVGRMENLPEFLKLQSPMLVPKIEKLFHFKGKQLSAELEEWKALPREEQLWVMGWIYSTTVKISKKNFLDGLMYFNLSTRKMMENIIKQEIDGSSVEDMSAFEAGYREGFRN